MQTIKLNNAVKNDEWTNREELPDPETLPTLPGYHVLVRPVTIRKQLKVVLCYLIQLKVI